MKKLIVLILAFFMLASIAAAEGPNDAAGQGTGNQDVSPQLTSAGQEDDPGTGQQLTISVTQQNKGEDSQIKEQMRVQEGDYVGEEGRKFSIEDSTDNRIRIRSGNQSANTSMNITKRVEGDKTFLNAQLSNGKNAEIKVMPSAASDRAIEVLGMKVCSSAAGCTIELKEVGKGDSVRAAYEVQAEKQARVLGLFKTRMAVSADIDAETGNVIKTSKPWWAFLASSEKVPKNTVAAE